MYITPLYGAILALLYVALSVRTLRMRRALGIPIGDSGDRTMLRTMRVHANFAEYVPLTLLLVFMLELNGASGLVVHGLCLCLLVGRTSHAIGVSRSDENFKFRVFGMAMTFVALIGAAARLLVAYGQAAIG